MNHYPNVVLSVRKPAMVPKIFPQSYTGVMGYGSRPVAELVVHYLAYAGNGESSFSSQDDNNENKAIGGRLGLEAPTSWGFDQLQVAAGGCDDSSPGAARTRVWGADAQIRRGPIEVLSEFASRTGAKQRRGFYLQPSWRLGPKSAVYYRYDLLQVEAPESPLETVEHTIGLNFRPVSDVSLKIELYRSIPSRYLDYNAVVLAMALAF